LAVFVIVLVLMPGWIVISPSPDTSMNGLQSGPSSCRFITLPQVSSTSTVVPIGK